MLVRGTQPATNIAGSANTKHGNGLRSIHCFAQGQRNGMAYPSTPTISHATQPARMHAPLRGPAFKGLRQRRPE